MYQLGVGIKFLLLNMEPIIQLKNISKIFKEKDGSQLAVLKNINLEILNGEFFIFLGPSGSGKSTLLRIISGLDKNYDGELKLNEQIKTTDLSFIFQQFAIFPWLTIYQNIEIGLIAKGLPEEKIKTIVEKELKQFNLLKFANSYPRDLSGGMRQRVGIARALAILPKIIFMDEPFSELDSFTAHELRQELLEIWRERKITIIMVTHNINEAIELADRIAVLTPRPGKIEKIIENNLTRPRQKRTQEFYALEDELYEIIKP